MEKCLVLGGKGFIGEYLVNALKQTKKYEITVADKKIEKELFSDGVKFVPISFEKGTDFASYLKGMETVVHLISTIFPDDNIDNLEQGVLDNVFPTIDLLRAMVKEKSKKIVFLSSGGTVYGNHDIKPIKEEENGFPISGYGIMKQLVERYIYLFNYYYGLDYRIIRLGNPYSIKNFEGRSQGLIPILINKLKKEETIQIWGDGEYIRDYIHIDDATDAILKIIEYKGDEKFFNVGNGKGYSINYIVEFLKKCMDVKKSRIEYVEKRKCDVDNNILNIDLLARQLDFRPKYSLEDGIKEILQSKK